MALARHQSGRRVQPDPAGTRQVRLGPGVQVGEIRPRARRTVKRDHIGGQLDQVAAHETRGVAQVPHGVHQQPGAIAAGALAFGERPLRAPHAGFEPHDIADALHHAAVEVHQHVDCAPRVARHLRNQRCQQRPGLFQPAVRGQFLLQRRVVGERPRLGFRLQEELEWVDDRHIGHEVHDHLKRRHTLWKHDPGEEITHRILLPVHEMRLGPDGERIGQDGGAGMRCRAEADRLRTQLHRAVIAVAGAVQQRGLNAHRVRLLACRPGASLSQPVVKPVRVPAVRVHSHRASAGPSGSPAQARSRGAAASLIPAPSPPLRPRRAGSAGR